MQDISSANLTLFPANWKNPHLLDYHESVIKRSQSVDEMDKVVKIHPDISRKIPSCMVFLLKSPFE